ncbi:MAG TPA: hypothetical protein VIV11_17175 [Kofleriaceae bacterium]
MTRNSQRGSAMLVAMILMAALLAGAAVLVSLQISSNRSTEMTKTGITALYCAEAGLTATRASIAVNQSEWGDYLGAGTEPTWLAVINHDIDPTLGGASDFTITLVDNDDEIPPTPDAPTVDSDGKIFIVSRCTMFPDTPREVRELVSFTEVTHCYGAQRGGCGANGNMNRAP